MAKANKKQFECVECGHTSSKWLGKCPSCNKWNSFVEVMAAPKEIAKQHRAELQSISDTKAVPQALNEIEGKSEFYRASGIEEFDRVLGGGFVDGSFILLGGDPGIGKSTLMLHLADNKEFKILYVSGEESITQIASRAKRLGIQNPQLKILAENDIHQILHYASKEKPDLLIVDSIQTAFRREISSMPGSVAQIRECSILLQQFAKTQSVPTLVIGHVTKDGDIAGPKLLEHMVDTVLQFEGDRSYTYRFLRSLKNRFGPAGEVGVFEMKGKGLVEVHSPSELFLQDRNTAISGSAIVPVLEGSRALLLEVQALVSSTSYGMPQRTTNGFDHRRLTMLLAVLEKRAGYPFGKHDAFLNIAGGLKLEDRSADCAVMMALVSAILNEPVPKDLILIGEVGLGAELRSVNQIDIRIKEAARMGFKAAIVPKSVRLSQESKSMMPQILYCETFGAAVNKTFK